MTDNTRANAGAGGDLIATDDVSGGVADGAKVTRVKAGWGADNAYFDPNLTTPLPVELVPIADAGGLSIGGVRVSAASNNATAVKGSAGKVYSVWAINVNAAIRYLKFYNKATAPAPASDTPVMVVPIPGNTAGAGIALSFPNGIYFATGIGIATVTGIGDTDNTSVGASEVCVQVAYK